MAKTGLARGLLGGLQTGLQIGQQAFKNKQQSDLNKAKIIQANNKAVGDANQAYTDELNKYNTRTDALNKRLSEASNETQRNNVSKMIEASDKQFSVITGAASQAGSKVATDISSNANPYIHDDVFRVTVGGKDFTVNSATYEDFKNNSDTYGLSEDGRNMVRKQLKSDTPLAGTEPEYMTTVVEDGIRSDAIFKEESQGGRSDFSIFRKDYLKDNPDANATEILQAFRAGKQRTTAGQKREERYNELKSKSESTEGLTRSEDNEFSPLQKTFEPEEYKLRVGTDIINRGKDVFEKGLANRNWNKADKNKAQSLQASILKRTDSATKKGLTDNFETAKANNLVIEQFEDIRNKIEDIGDSPEAIKKEKAEKGYVSNALTWIGARVGDGALTEGQAEQLEKNIQLNTRTGYLMATYIKMLSGAAASQQEVDRLTNMITGGAGVTEDTLLKAITEFAEISKDKNKIVLEEVRDFMPRSAMDIKTGFKGSNKPSKAKAKSKYKSGQRARQNGVLFEYDGTRWNKVKE